MAKKEFVLNTKLQPKQLKLLHTVRDGKVRHPFFGGSRGGGKSFASRVILLTMLLENSGTEGLLLRRTYKTLAANHIRKMWQEYPELRNYFNKSDGVLYLPNGSNLVFGHSEHEDDIFQYQGQEYPFIAVEELTQFTEFQWNILATSNRTAIRGIKPVMWGTGNPGGVGHLWAKRLWIDGSYEEGEEPNDYSYIPSRVWDNPALALADPKYVAVLKRIKDPMLRRAYLNGDWDIFPGQYFTQFDRRKVEVGSFYIPESWPLFGSMDYGESDPTSFGLYTCDPLSGIFYRISEYYQGDRACSQHIEGIKDRILGCPFTGGRFPDVIYAGHDCWTKRRFGETDVRCVAEEFITEGLYLTRANRDRINGWRMCKDALVHDRFKIFSGWNDHFLRTVPAVPRDDNNVEDVNEDAEDHAADEWRYFMIHAYKQGVEEQIIHQGEFSGSRLIEDLKTARMPTMNSKYSMVGVN